VHLRLRPARPLASLLESLQLQLAIRRRHPGAVAACLARRIPRRAAGPARARVAYLAKPIFNDDIAAMQQFGGRLEYVPVPSTDVRRVYYSFVSERYHHNHASYYRDGNVAERQQYFAFIRRVFEILRDQHDIAAVVSANYNYCWQQEVARACVELNLPLVVLHKEGVNLCANHKDAVTEHACSRFVGHVVLTYNQAVTTALLNVGIEGLDAGHVQVVGVPRLDSYVRRPPAAGDTVAFFSFAPHVPLEQRPSGAAIEQRTRAFYQLPLHFAARHPQIRVVMKFKNSAAHRSLRDITIAQYGRRLPANLSMTSSGHPESIIRGARAVASCNSTTLLEGLLAGRRLITPDYEDVVAGGLADCFTAYPHMVTRAATLDAFERGVFGTGGSTAADPALVDELMGRGDGRASERVEEAIAALIARHSRAPIGAG